MRIALVAMSGIRACDPELLRLGLTLPGFEGRRRAVADLPSLGLLTLAGMTPPRHEVAYLEVADLPPAWAPEGFDLVAISSFSAQIDEAYALAGRLRAARVPVVIGGLHATVLPREALGHADAVACGEGEMVWERILEDAERGRLGGIYGSTEPPFDLARAPLPAFHLLDVRRYNRLTVQTSRGCPHRCEFCAGSVLLGGRYRQKPAGRVLEEIDRIRSLWPRPFLEFADDDALVNREYWKQLLPEIRRRRMRWFAETDISIARDEELLDLMRDSGCVQVLIGLESPAEKPLRGIELHSDWKRRQRPVYREAIAAIQSRGIRVNGCFILGLDGQGPGVFGEVESFVRETGLCDVQVTIQTPFPGTPLHARLRREGRLLADGRWERCTLFDVTYRPLGMTPGQLREGFRDLIRSLYGEEATRRRRALIRKCLDNRRRRCRPAAA